jgi:integration host factor subunit alpha
LPSVTAPRLSALSRMMLQSAEAALSEHDYVSAFEYILTVASVDDHPEVTVVFAVTLLDIIEALDLAPGTLRAKERLLAAESNINTPQGYSAIRKCFERDALMHILYLVRSFSSTKLRRSKKSDSVALTIVQKISALTKGSNPTRTQNRPLKAKTLTRADLAEAVFEKAGLPRNEAAELMELILKQVVYALERGESIKLSSFGTFGVRQKSERVGRNPKTGEVVPITPRRVIVFKASNIMIDRINASLKKTAPLRKSVGLKLVS